MIVTCCCTIFGGERIGCNWLLCLTTTTHVFDNFREGQLLGFLPWLRARPFIW